MKLEFIFSPGTLPGDVIVSWRVGFDNFSPRKVVGKHNAKQGLSL